MAETQRTDAGGANLVGRVDVVQVAATETGWDWCDVVDELGSALTSLKRDTSAIFVGPLRSLMRYLSSERQNQKKKSSRF